MTTQGQLLPPLLERLDNLMHLVDESPYLPREVRKDLEIEILRLMDKLKEGNLAFPNGEKAVSELNKKIVSEEIDSLIKKISLLNPSSPRLQTLRELSGRLNQGEISSDQARQGIIKLMSG